MATKNNPGAFDCYDNADPDEPLFTLLGRDKCAPILVREWAEMRISDGKNDIDDAQIVEARQCADDMERRRRGHPKTLKVVWADAVLDRAQEMLVSMLNRFGGADEIEALQVGIDAIRTVKGN